LHVYERILGGIKVGSGPESINFLLSRAHRNIRAQLRHFLAFSPDIAKIPMRFAFFDFSFRFGLAIDSGAFEMESKWLLHLIAASQASATRFHWLSEWRASANMNGVMIDFIMFLVSLRRFQFLAEIPLSISTHPSAG
jgi:hypothetical protein